MKSINNYISEKLILKKNKTSKKVFDDLDILTDEIYKRYNENKKVIDVSDIELSPELTMLSCLFSEYPLLEKITGLDDWNVSNITSLRSLFKNCDKLTTIEGLDDWDVSNVKRMEQMFAGCKSLQNIGDINNWKINTSTNTDNMFAGCNQNIKPIWYYN